MTVNPIPAVPQIDPDRPWEIKGLGDWMLSVEARLTLLGQVFGNSVAEDLAQDVIDPSPENSAP